MVLGGIGEGDKNLEGINDGVSISEGIAELISEIVLDREVVEGTDKITYPVTDSEKEIVSVVNRVLEVNWEHGGESFLGEGSEEKNESE